MKNRAFFAAFALATSFSAWSITIELDKLAADSTRTVAVADKRSAEEKVYHRDGIRSPVQYFGDKDFASPPLDQFAQLLGSKLPPGSHELEVGKFRIIDIFPQRLHAATAGAMAGALGALGYTAFFHDPDNITQDNITCLVEGALAGKPVSVSVSVPYKMSPMAGLVKHDPDFKKAVNGCLDLLAEKVAQSP
jgi:hypothetical protein